MKANILTITVTVAMLAAGGAVAAETEKAAPPSVKEAPKAEAAAQPLVQIALLLDTSSSMDGMINQAKSQLWGIINQFAAARHNGKAPSIQVALYQYGTPSLGSDNGYIRQILPLTSDLDKISEELFALRTNGGDEYCGWVIKNAVEDLKWSEKSTDYKAIFIAGNESFAQGKIDFKSSCKASIEKGIIVNTIHCSGGSDDSWKEAALLADGACITIDANKSVVQINTPFDKKLEELNAKLNSTYVAYGAKGKVSEERQREMDRMNLSMGSTTASQRYAAKSSRNYSNAQWDLVDAKLHDTVDIKKLKDADFPAEMKGMSVEERESYIQNKAEERKNIQSEIKTTIAARDKYIAAELKKNTATDDSFGEAVNASVTEQAAKIGFTFEKN